MGSTISGCFFCVCSTGEKPFSVGLVDQLFQLVSNQFEMVEKAFGLLAARLLLAYGLLPDVTTFQLKTITVVKCYSDKHQPYQPKLVVVETIIPL